MLVLGTERNNNILPSTGEVDANTRYCLWLVLQTHRGQQETVVSHEVGDLCDISRHLNERSAFQEVVVRMVDSYFKA